MEYDPRNWFWIVAGDETKVFSSASGDFVTVTAPAYQAWRASGGAPTRIASTAELGEVLAPLSLRPSNATVLDAYKDAQASQISIKVAAKVLFNHENRIRALEGKNAITANQFKNALKDLM
jgi:hypothetical protein